MSASLVCQACDTLTMMNYCPKCDSATVPYEPRGSGMLCVGPPPRRAPSVPSSAMHHDIHEGRLSTRRNSLLSANNKPPYEALARRLSPSVDRNTTPERPETDENAQEQLAKERELMIQSANDILRITEGFQQAQKRSIRVIDRLYQENQDLKHHAGLQRDTDPQGWRKKFGFPPAGSAPPSAPSPVQPAAPEPPRARSNRFSAPAPPSELDDELLDDIERRARAVEKELDYLIQGLGEAERIASEERVRLTSRLESQGRSSMAASELPRSRLVSSYQ